MSQCLIRSHHCVTDDMVPWQSAHTTYMSTSKNQPTRPRTYHLFNLLEIHFLVQSSESGYFHSAVSRSKRAKNTADSAFTYSSTKCWLNPNQIIFTVPISSPLLCQSNVTSQRVLRECLCVGVNSLCSSSGTFIHSIFFSLVFIVFLPCTGH